LVFVFGQVMRLSLILYLVSLLVREMTGLDPYLCILIGGVVTSFYTITGGIEAVICTDFIQSFLLWAGGFVCMFLAIYHVDGGLITVIKTAAADGKFMFGDLNMTTGKLEAAPWGFSLTEKTVVMMLLVGLTNWLTEYSSNQNVIQKYCASKNPREAFKAIWICCLCSVPTWAFFMFLGTCLYVFFKFHPTPEATAMLTGGQKADQILPYFVVQYLPTGMSGLVIAGVLAAAMSSLSSSINAISAVTIVDVYKRHVVKNGSERNYVIAAKTVSVIASVLMVGGAAGLMMAESKTLQDTATKLGAVMAGGLLGLYMLGFLTRRGDGRAVAAGITCALIFSAWISVIELGWITEAGLQRGLGLSEAWAHWLIKPLDTYYTGMVGNLMMFVIAYAVASVLWSKPRDLTNLTVWTTDDTPQQ